MGNITVRIIPHAEFKGKKIIKVSDWYEVKGSTQKFPTLEKATDSIK